MDKASKTNVKIPSQMEVPPPHKLPTLLATNYGADNWSWKETKQNDRTKKSWHLLSFVLLGPVRT